MLEVLLVLNLKGVSLDQEKEIDKKEKKLQAHKSRILQLSKKERKVIMGKTPYVVLLVNFLLFLF